MIRLEKGDIAGGLSVLERFAIGRPISPQTFSSVKNISILYLHQAFTDRCIRTGKLYKGLYFSGKLVRSPHMDKYCKLVGGIKAPVNRKHLVRAFVDEVFMCSERHISVSGGLTSRSMLKYFQTFEEDIQRYVMGKIINSPIRKIESEIETSRQKRLQDPGAALITGKLLFKNTLNEMALLRSILSGTHIIYQIISDKLANEVLQCAIDAFNLSVKKNDASGADVKSLILVKCASSLAAGQRTKTRVYDSFNAVKKWMEKNKRQIKKSNEKLSVNQ